MFIHARFWRLFCNGRPTLLARTTWTIRSSEFDLLKGLAYKKASRNSFFVFASSTKSAFEDVPDGPCVVVARVYLEVRFTYRRARLQRLRSHADKRTDT